MNERYAIAAGFFGSMTGFASKMLFQKWWPSSLLINIIINIVTLSLYILLTLIQTMTFIRALRSLPVATATIVSFLANTMTCVIL